MFKSNDKRNTEVCDEMQLASQTLYGNRNEKQTSLKTDEDVKAAETITFMQNEQKLLQERKVIRSMMKPVQLQEKVYKKRSI